MKYIKLLKEHTKDRMIDSERLSKKFDNYDEVLHGMGWGGNIPVEILRTLKYAWITFALDQLNMPYNKLSGSQISINELGGESNRYHFIISIRSDKITLVVRDNEDLDGDMFEYPCESIKGLMKNIFKYVPEFITNKVLKKINN